MRRRAEGAASIKRQMIYSGRQNAGGNKPLCARARMSKVTQALVAKGPRAEATWARQSGVSAAKKLRSYQFRHSNFATYVAAVECKLSMDVPKAP